MNSTVSAATTSHSMMSKTIDQPLVNSRSLSMTTDATLSSTSVMMAAWTIADVRSPGRPRSRIS
jgi:hypothetical protein